MYVALYDQDKRHITNLTGVTYELTRRVYDMDNFSCSVSYDYVSADIKDAKYLILNDDSGNYIYSCFVDTVAPEDNSCKIKGLDFKTLWDTDIVLDYTQEGSFDKRLSKIVEKVKNLVFPDNEDDPVIKKIGVKLRAFTYDCDTDDFGDREGLREIVNAYKFLKPYLKYYGFNLETRFNVRKDIIVFSFKKHKKIVKAELNDLDFELQTDSSAPNKAVAMTEDGTGVRVFYRGTDNEIYLDTDYPEVRIYPVKTKIFQSEYLADAMYKAAEELANARYVDNVIIKCSQDNDTAGLIGLPLYTIVELYRNRVKYKCLPISEIQTVSDGDGENTKIKLGFKKILLTEIIKNQ